MYKKAYGIIETLAPLHVGAAAGEESGNLNLIFRDQFTQTGIIAGSSIRGRFRADMREADKGSENTWYGHESVEGRPDGGTTEAIVKFEYASLVWLPVFCPGQPVVWISCPRLLKRYKLITGSTDAIPKPYTSAKTLRGRQISDRGTAKQILFFNLGFMEIEHQIEAEAMQKWIPKGVDLAVESLVVVGDNDIAMLHDMALYRQSRIKMMDDMKKVDGGAFFNVEALPEGSVLIFPIALKELGWKPFGDRASQDMYFGGLESVGFGRCNVTLAGEYQ
ncbi:type III-B CRISPR module RAMP protein Cmr4 [Pseudanabaena sp. FACHB-1277]|uniref:Type III-B CRISPR module RAMP protein Cmr4 n=1 Tax=Pseudanabaena cinerea FACHB-1277 TaxID=2949581 RepID=A0A926UVU0_9CYAN|nr:RAMP superfamily CRISPR-associated protein [Pseudanabaena cinerea]MBD2150972.1 type III-B CRISPR module RAMP protein Cmr4 [Pseudanabaena cinerea FACHB-1277]